MSGDPLARIRGRLGGLATSARHDTREQTAAARSAFLSRFLVEVDPHRVLPEHERDRRAVAARKAYFARLALLSAEARAQRSRRRR